MNNNPIKTWNEFDFIEHLTTVFKHTLNTLFINIIIISSSFENYTWTCEESTECPAMYLSKTKETEKFH